MSKEMTEQLFFQQKEDLINTAFKKEFAKGEDEVVVLDSICYEENVPREGNEENSGKSESVSSDGSSTDSDEEEMEDGQSSLPDFGIPNMNFNEEIQAPVIVYDSRTHPGCVRQYIRGKGTKNLQNSFAWYCLPCRSLLESQPNFEDAAMENVPKIIVFDGRIRTDPDFPGKTPHICTPEAKIEENSVPNEQNAKVCRRKGQPKKVEKLAEKSSKSVEADVQPPEECFFISDLAEVEESMRKVAEKYGCKILKSNSILAVVSRKFHWNHMPSPAFGDMQLAVEVSVVKGGGLLLMEKHLIITRSLLTLTPSVRGSRRLVRGCCSVQMANVFLEESLEFWLRKYEICEQILTDLAKIERLCTPEAEKSQESEYSKYISARRQKFGSAVEFSRKTRFSFAFSPVAAMKVAFQLRSTASSPTTTSRDVCGWLIFGSNRFRFEIDSLQSWERNFKTLKQALPNCLVPSRVNLEGISSSSEIMGSESGEVAHNYGVTAREVEERYFRSDLDALSMIARVAGVEETERSEIKRGGFYAEHREEIEKKWDNTKKLQPRAVGSGWRSKNENATGRCEEEKVEENDLEKVENVLKKILDQRGTDRQCYLLGLSAGKAPVLSAIFYKPSLLKRYTVKIKKSQGNSYLCRAEEYHRLSTVNSFWKFTSATNWQDIAGTDPWVFLPPIIDSVMEWIFEDVASSSESTSVAKRENREEKELTSVLKSATELELKNEDHSEGGRSFAGVCATCTAVVKRELPLEEEMLDQKKRIKLEDEGDDLMSAGGISATELMGF